jgi:hypothetical protein
MRKMKNIKTAIVEIERELAKVLTCEFDVRETRVYNRAEKLVPGIEVTYPGLDCMDTKVEEYGRFFDVELFTMGIRQRANWINATEAEKQGAWDMGIHPAMYGK